jgi:hypothetical protein
LPVFYQYVLERVDEPNPAAGHSTPMLPPLMVIQILAQNKRTPLRAAKDYIVRNLERQDADIVNDRSAIRRLQDETAKMRDECDELRTQPKTFNAPKCHMCTSAIELPAVHYLCGHSFHQRCLNDNDKHCPKCYPDFKRGAFSVLGLSFISLLGLNNSLMIARECFMFRLAVLDVKESMRQGVNHHEKFFKQLENSSDGFATVAEYFGRGMFMGSAAAGSAAPLSGAAAAERAAKANSR